MIIFILSINYLWWGVVQQEEQRSKGGRSDSRGRLAWAGHTGRPHTANTGGREQLLVGKQLPNKHLCRSMLARTTRHLDLPQAELSSQPSWQRYQYTCAPAGKSSTEVA